MGGFKRATDTLRDYQNRSLQVQSPEAGWLPQKEVAEPLGQKSHLKGTSDFRGWRGAGDKTRGKEKELELPVTPG